MAFRWQHYLLASAISLSGCFLWAADDFAKTPRFAVRSARGATVEGTWRELKKDWSIRIGDGDGTLIAGRDVLSLRRLDTLLPPFPSDDHLILVNGDRIPYQTLRLAGEKLRLRHPNLEQGKEATLPLAAVAVLWRIAPDKVLDAEKYRRRLTTSARTRDVVRLRNGDVVAGVLSSLDDKNVVVEVETKKVTLKMPQVAYVAFNTELADAMKPKGLYARVILTDTSEGKGGRLSLTSASRDGEALTGVTAFGARLRVPVRHVAALDIQQGKAVYLSDLKPSKYEYIPYLDEAWPYALDGNVADHDLLLSGSTYDKGIGMHSHSRLTYRLAGGYRRFEALVGLDDKDGRRGSVRIRVLADGKPVDLGLDRELTAHSGPLPVSISVAGVRELTLEVLFGKQGNVQDAVDWVDARLVK
jgi:hypothetical protein